MKNLIAFLVVIRSDYHYSNEFFSGVNLNFPRTGKNHLHTGSEVL